jgi:hypothetical protein
MVCQMTNLLDLPSKEMHAFETTLAEVVSAEDAQQVLKDASLKVTLLAAIAAVFAAAKIIFKLAAERAKSLADLITAGNYGTVYGRENAEHFSDDDGDEDVEAFYYHHGNAATDQEILDALESKGLRILSLRRLLVHGARKPEEQRKFPIAIINPHPDRDGRRWDAVLSGDDRRRYLSLYWNGPQAEWNGHCRFLVAHK